MLMWFSTVVFLFYQFVLRVLPNVMFGPLSISFGISPIEMGYFSSLYYIGYTGMHIPLGMLMDRFGIKRIVPLCVALTSIGLIPLIYSESWYLAVAGRFLLGMASSAAVLSVFRASRICFGEKHFSTALGIAVTLGILGAVYGGRPVDALMEVLGWKSVINILIVFGLVMAPMVYLSMPKSQKTEPSFQPKSSVMDDLKAVCLEPRIILLSMFGGLMLGLLEGFADAWGTLFFEKVYTLDRQTSATLPSIIFFGMCVGSPILGYIGEKTKGYYSGIIMSGIAMLICFSCILYYDLSLYFLYTAVFLSGFFCAYQILVISKVRHFASTRLLDMTSTVSNMVMMIFGFVFHNVIGSLMEFFREVDGTISPTSLKYCLTSINVALVIAVVGVMFMLIADKRKYGSSVIH